MDCEAGRWGPWRSPGHQFLLFWLREFGWSLPGWSSFLCLPLDFHGKLQVIRSVFILGALRGIEASFLADAGLRKLRSAILRVVWSHRQLAASVGAVLGLMDGPQASDPAFCVVWLRFRMLRRYLAHRPGEVGRVYQLLHSVT